jgi:hypothetical protein
LLCFETTSVQCTVLRKQHFFFKSLVKVLSIFQLSANTKKVMQTWNSNLASILEVHRQIWPDEDVELLKSKQTRLDDREQDIWFLETTMPTSMFIAFIVFSLKNKFRKREVRAKTAEGFNSLCSLLFASLSGVTIPHIPLGTNRAATISVNASGLVNASSLWTRNFFVSRVQKTWSEDFVDPAKTWLLHENGFGNIALPEFLEFCLDPQHDSSLQHELFGPALSLFSYIAFHLDEGVGFLQRDGPELDYVATVFKNKRRAATNLKSVFAEQVAQKLWKGEDSYLKKEICFMMFFW